MHSYKNLCVYVYVRVKKKCVCLCRCVYVCLSKDNIDNCWDYLSAVESILYEFMLTTSLATKSHPFTVGMNRGNRKSIVRVSSNSLLACETLFRVLDF